VQLAVGPWDRKADAAGQQPHQIVGLKVNGRTGVEMERAAVGK